MQKRIFLVENDIDTQKFFRDALNPSEYDVTCVTRGEDLPVYAKVQIPHVILLDVLEPEYNGIEIIRFIRNNELLKQIPVIILSENVSEIEKVKSLDSGADDYIMKPVGPLELAARVRAVLRRGCIAKKSGYYCKDLFLDTQSHEVYKGGNSINLTLMEYNLLLCLLDNKGRVVNRQHISEKLWNNKYDNQLRTIDIHITTLRKKTGDSPNGKSYITTVRNIGYIIENDGLS